MITSLCMLACGRKWNFLQLVLYFMVLQMSLEEDPIASKQHFKESEQLKRRCSYSLRKLWEADVSSFPFAASPLIADVNGDQKWDVVAAPFGETITVVEGDTGKHLQGSSWPQHNLDKSIHSSPLQFDIDKDGTLDLLFITSKGEGFFYNKDGYHMQTYTFQIDPAYVKSGWFNSMEEPDHRNLQKNVVEESMPGFIPVDPHVLDTPVLHENRFLIFPLSFFFSDDDYSDEEAGPWGSDGEQKDKYYVTGVLIVDVKKLATGLREAQHKSGPWSPMKISPYSRVVFLELSQTPVVNLFSPTVVDVDGDFSPAEIILGSSSGKLFVLTLDGQHRNGYPHTFTSISGKVTAVNLDESSHGMELIVGDRAGNITCLDAVMGKKKWLASVGGTSFAGSSVVDVDTDGQLDVVVATSDGYVYALNGLSGEVVPNFPYKASKGISGNVLVTKFNRIRGPYDLVFLSDDGLLYILASDLSCESRVALGETTLVDMLLHDLSPVASRGAELLVATSDGSLVCLGSGERTPPEELVEQESKVLLQRLAVPDGVTNRPLSLSKGVILLEPWMRHMREVTGSTLDIYFTIHSKARADVFNLRVYMGSELVHQEDRLESSLAIQLMTVRTPEQPGQAQVTVLIYDKTGYVSHDSLHLRFNQLILLDLQWLVVSPFIAMLIIVLVNHGFPAKDLLPVTFPFKSK